MPMIGTITRVIMMIIMPVTAGRGSGAVPTHRG